MLFWFKNSSLAIVVERAFSSMSSFIQQVHSCDPPQEDPQMDYAAFCMWRTHRAELERYAQEIEGMVILPGYPYHFPNDDDPIAWLPLPELWTFVVRPDVIRRIPTATRNITDMTIYHAFFAAMFEDIWRINHASRW